MQQCVKRIILHLLLYLASRIIFGGSTICSVVNWIIALSKECFNKPPTDEVWDEREIKWHANFEKVLSLSIFNSVIDFAPGLWLNVVDSLTNCGLNKMPAIRQMMIKNALKLNCIWIKFHWNWSLQVFLTICHHLCRQRRGVEHSIINYLTP